MSQEQNLMGRFEGGLLGLMVGDALGAHFEGWAADEIAEQCGSRESLIADGPRGLWFPWHYTDDTEMAFGVAQALIADGEMLAPTLFGAWAANYTPHRGYGATRLVLEALRRGEDAQAVAQSLFPGGSFGNGAAMRVAPVGLFFHDDLDRVWEQAGLSATPTHAHPLAVEGAQLVALAVALAMDAAEFDRDRFLAELRRRCQTDEFRAKLDSARSLESRADLGRLGNRVTAVESAVTAIACFAFSPDSYPATVADAIFLGGDTDTIAAMAGAISGARLGMAALPQHLLDAVEDGDKGIAFGRALAVQLHDAWRASRAS